MTSMAALISRAAWHRSDSVVKKNRTEIETIMSGSHTRSSVIYVRPQDELAVMPFPNPLTLAQD